MEVVLALIAIGAVAALVIVLARDREAPRDPVLDQTLGELRSALGDLATNQGVAAAEVRTSLDAMVTAQGQMARDTSNLSQALSRPGVRGRWGELTLRNVVEAVGLAEHVDFDTQTHIRGDGHDPAARPDLVLRLPGDGRVPVDAKLPLDPFRDAIEAESVEAREAALDRHVQAVRGKVRELASKAYWERFTRSPEMVVMFVASEAAFSAAVQREPQILEEAARSRVVITTPATMVALLQVVALGWRERNLAENGEQVRALAEELVKRMGVLAGHMGKVGDSLEKAARAHNDAVASYEGRLLVTARRMGELGIAGADQLEEPVRVVSAPRKPVAEIGVGEQTPPL